MYNLQKAVAAESMALINILSPEAQYIANQAKAHQNTLLYGAAW